MDSPDARSRIRNHCLPGGRRRLASVAALPGALTPACHPQSSSMEGSTGSKFRSIALPHSKETTSVMEMSMVLELPRCNCHHPLMQFHWTSKELQEQRLGCSKFPNLEYPVHEISL
ncbi:unnamed protein product [Urochloa humidicola]